MTLAPTLCVRRSVLSLLLTAAVRLAQGGAPESTSWGIVLSLFSIVTMWALIRLKVSVGRALGSAAVLADAA